MKASTICVCLGLLTGIPLAMACGSGPKPIHYGAFVYPVQPPKAPAVSAKTPAPAKISERPAQKG